MFTNSTAILTKIKSILDAGVTLQNVNISLDEPLNLIYSDLPAISIYPIREDFIYEESYNQDKKHLSVRIELRMKNGPASNTCSPVINQIAGLLKSNRTLDGLADYVELQSIQWANEQIEQGIVSGASLDIQVQYLV